MSNDVTEKQADSLPQASTQEHTELTQNQDTSQLTHPAQSKDLIEANNGSVEFTDLDLYKLENMIVEKKGHTDQDEFNNRLRKEQQDHEHKLAILKLQHEQEKFQHEQKMAEIEKDIKKEKMTSVLTSWQETQKEERKLRQIVSIFLLCITSGLVVGGLAAFTLFSVGLMQVTNESKWMATTFFGTVFTAIAAMAQFVVKGLFPAKKEDSLSEINKFVEKL